MPAPLILTVGEPAGIGPDLVIQLAQQNKLLNDVVVAANPALLESRAALLGLPLSIVNRPVSSPASKPGTLQVLPFDLSGRVEPGRLNTNHAQYVIDTLTQATQGCLNGEYSALVTAPVHKGIINEAGIPFTGHTELLAQLCGGVHPLMLLAAGSLRVALVTTHLPLAEIPAAITESRITRIVEILNDGLKTGFEIPQPRILVCGLNPHAGEDGHLGSEEIDTIIPTLEKLRQTGINLVGPLPADTAFTPRHLAQADAVLAMYHDQGLPVLKHAGFGHAVNITLGLPIIRTSVDHGTALSLAGTGQAETGSLEAALKAARSMVAIKAGGSFQTG